MTTRRIVPRNHRSLLLTGSEARSARQGPRRTLGARRRPQNGPKARFRHGRRVAREKVTRALNSPRKGGTFMSWPIFSTMHFAAATALRQPAWTGCHGQAADHVGLPLVSKAGDRNHRIREGRKPTAPPTQHGALNAAAPGKAPRRTRPCAARAQRSPPAAPGESFVFYPKPTSMSLGYFCVAHRSPPVSDQGLNGEGIQK